jgi:hypothetical protein
METYAETYLDGNPVPATQLGMRTCNSQQNLHMFHCFDTVR